MMCLKDFTSSVKKASKVDPAIERWFHGTRELERELSERVIYLCSYFDRIPEQAQSEYADVLIETLRSETSNVTSLVSERIANNIREFATCLEHSEDPAKIEKAKLLRQIVQLERSTQSEAS